jgi:hypothetical protein
MSQFKVNKQNRDQIIAEYIDRTIDEMNIKGLIDFVRGGIEADLKHYSDTELELITMSCLKNLKNPHCEKFFFHKFS